ncbi:type VI secretion system protein TssA [Metakosakonia massiliensis]|uniref:ImpA N-terminal domain-containing protein n=1 Tax=Phytobacter massiliensis TaxID=1485952 RepID=A0A6N3AFX7_9ENTR
MDGLQHHPWRKILLSDIRDIAIPVDEESAEWEALDAAVATIGTVSHSQINMDDVRHNALILLGKTKDLRVLAHLLRTLQHGKKPQDVTLALLLFADYCEHFWHSAAPQARAKSRLLKQILIRFGQAQEAFNLSSTAIERELALDCLRRIREALAEHQESIESIDQLYAGYSKKEENQAGEVVSSTRREDAVQIARAPAEYLASEAKVPAVAPTPGVAINTASEIEWKRTLLKVAEILCERIPQDPIGFRLRRHAIFASLTEPLNREGKTDLAPFPADRESDIKAGITHASVGEWIQVENILTSTPFWLEGHFISARIALQQNYSAVACAIKDELLALLQRLPMLRNFRYSDDSAFMSDEMKAWLDGRGSGASTFNAADESSSVLQCFSEQGLEAALALLNEKPIDNDLRGHYHQLKCSVQLLAEAGYKTLAVRQAESLWSACKTLTLEQWEPSFFEDLSALQNTK